MSGLLGPSGSPIAELGGERAWRQYTKGDIVVSYQWLDLRPYGCDEEKGPEPCMVLFSASRRLNTGAKVIRARDAHMYAANTGHAAALMMQSALDTAETLGFDRNEKSTVFRIIDIVLDGIPDLIAMPSEQPASLNVQQATQGIVTTVRIGGNTVHQEIR